MDDFSSKAQEQLRSLQHKGLLRRLVPLTQSGAGNIVLSGKTYLNLSGNDYLGLASDSELIATFYSQLTADSLLERFGPGAAASRLMTGNSPLYDQLEQKLAGLYGCDRALVFNSGYHGNAGILPALAEKGDLILADKLCHASLIDGMQLSRADTIRYRHLNNEHLASLLEQKRDHYSRIFIVTESVFSMDGDLVDLHKLVQLKERFNCRLYLDEAHGVGVFGPNGLGLAEQEGLVHKIDLLFGTFGKALGGLGGFVICADEIADYLINKARSFIYSTALPPVCLSWLLFVLERIPAMKDERKRLQQLSASFRQKLVQAGLTTGGSSQIVPVIIGDSTRTLTVAEKLRDTGYWVTAVRPPTVPANTARLRLSLSTAHTPGDLARLPGLIKSVIG